MQMKKIFDLQSFGNLTVWPILFQNLMPVVFQPTHPRNNSKGSAERGCRICKKRRGVIRSYGINMCRRCFRERADKLGFVKYD